MGKYIDGLRSRLGYFGLYHPDDTKNGANNEGGEKMSYCDTCLHKNVCGLEGVDDKAMTFCDDKLGWIPVSERLPEFNDVVLASTDSIYDELKVVLTVYKSEKHWFDGTVIAWMPLPSPYKAEKGEADGK